MAVYLIQNGVNKRSTAWADQQSKHNGGGTAVSPSIDWSTSSKLRIGFYLNANSYSFTLSGWNSAYNASSYAKLYVKCYASWLTESETSGKIVVTQYGSEDDTGLSQNIPTSEGTLSFNLSSLSSSARSSIQVYMYLYRHVRTAMTLYGYIKDMWLTRNFTITYNANGGSGAPSAQTFEEGTRTLSATTPTRSGYSFLGWSESSTATTATYGAGGSINLNANKVLYAVWKAELSTVSTGNGTIGTSQNITITQQGSNFAYRHTLKWTVNGTTQTIASGLTGGSATITYAWTPPASIVPLYTDRKTYPCTITCETYSGITLLGSKTTSITLTVPNNYAPAFSSHSITRTSGTYPAGFTGWVSGKTTPVIAATVAPQQNATIVSWAYTVNGSVTSVSDTSASKTWTGPALTSGSITITVTDSRGLTASYSETVTVTPYTAPSISNAVMTRAESDGTVSAQGQYLKTTADIVITGLDGTNTKKYSIEYKENGSSIWQSLAANVDLSSYTEVFSWLSSSGVILDSKSYDTRLIVTDFFGSSTFTTTVSTALSIMDFKANGLGVAFGKVHEEADRTVVIAKNWDLRHGDTSLGDTGWIEPELSSEFAQYSASDFYKVRYRRVGGVVHLAGTIKPTAAITGDTTQHTIFTLPVGFRPAATVDIICQGSTTCVWLLQVHYTGAVSFSRYRNEAGYQTANTSVWLPFSATFIPA